MSVKKTLRVQAYDLIKDKIINCVYRPGEMINEERLIEELNLTRTPIRDALGRLEQEGLVQIRPKRGILITPLDFQKVSDLLEARLMYETYAIREYGKCMKEEDLISCFVAIQDSMDNSDDDILNPVDSKLHSLIIQAVPNAHIRSSYESVDIFLKRLRIRLRILTGESRQHSEISQNEHLEIVKACMKKDWALAETALRDHLTRSAGVVIDLFLSQFHEKSA
ncbi:MAG: GntR family transcriptional regulator [Spirochaetota bacterium]|nr:GntR family transcriptional regulator [Spirochaetota bacterium]